MSSMIQPPPRQINIGGAVGAFPLPRPQDGAPSGPPAAPPAAGGADSGSGDPDAGSVTDKLRKALSLVQSAAQQEKDDIDGASITKIAALLHSAIAAEQKLNDDVMGGGPGAKMVRKVQGPGSGY